MLRRIISDRLREFHRLLVAEFSSDSEDFLERIQLSSMRCPACGGQMALARTITTFDSRETENVFACVRCGLSYLTEDHIPVNGRAVI
jgi:YgiT-type zinc finger domain-containing protein